MKRSSFFNFHTSRAFTLLELMVSVGIFALLTTLVVAKYGNFNGSVLLTNLAYDVAITIRTAQSYGLSVKDFNTTPGAVDRFKYGYGVHFTSDGGLNDKMILFADNASVNVGFINIVPNNGVYNIGAPPFGDTVISTYYLKRGATISELCVGSSSDKCKDNPSSVDITFKRPDPDARICSVFLDCNSSPYTEITIKGTDSSTRKVSVRENGQISVVE
ncbi:MAG: type II secretion system protein [Patescibacteria group bacterium]